jgi:uncharacterized protein (TIGR02145 family)/uncharacterized repeat protein (TIGR02543 family)
LLTYNRQYVFWQWTYYPKPKDIIMKKTVFAIVSAMLFSLCAIERNNPLDEDGTNYQPPKVTIESVESSITNGDTIHFDTGTVSVTGNRAESRFQASIDSGAWSGWQTEGVFKYGPLTEGNHTVRIQTKYEGGDSIVDATVEFFVQTVGYKPMYTTASDTVISTDTGKVVTIAAPSVGMKPIAYRWLKNASVVNDTITDTLRLASVQYSDSGLYSCIATNPWGEDTSRGYRVRIVHVPVITYTVTYNGNGNTAGAVPIDANAYVQGASATVKANTGALARTGFTFAGWNTTAAGTGTFQAGGDPLTIGTANVILFAKWTQNATFSVTYNGNGNTAGAVPADPNAYEQGTTVFVKGNSGTLARIGYTFAGWNTNAAGTGVSYAGSDPLTIGSANVVLFAKWTQNATFSVTYNGNGNTAGAFPVDANAYEQGATVFIKANPGALARTGYTFAGWNTATAGTGTAYAGGDPLTIGAANVTLFAKWTQNATFSVTYNGNSNTTGSAPVDANAYEQGATVTVKANTGNLVRTGYTFSGWNTLATGAGASYAGGESLTLGSVNMTLYALWTLIPTYTVTYNGNNSTGGAVPTDVNTYTQGATVTVFGNTGSLAKTGYSFANWNTAAAGTGTTYAAGATFPIGATNVTLYAQWTLIPTYTVTYNGNGNTGGVIPTDANTYTQGSAVTVLGNTGSLVKTGSTFAGWNTAADGTGITRATGETFTMVAANVILYAKWTSVYTVTYNGNGNTGGSAPTDANTYNNGVTVTVLDNIGNLTKSNYTFEGWNTNTAGTGTQRTPGSTFAIGSTNVVLYAKWTPNTYIVTFDGQGATVAPNPATSNVTTPASTVGSLPTPPAKTGYVFDGWWTATNGGGTAFTTGTAVTVNITVFAKWIIKDKDGNVYTEVTIGTQTWMKENLKTMRFNDGTSIPLAEGPADWAATDAPTPMFCWYNNDSTYKATYGALYNWAAVNTGKLAPQGWHVPSDAEWTTLGNELGGADVAGGKLKESGLAHWTSPNTGATNASGFTGLPGGMNYYGTFSVLGVTGYWWSSTDYGSSYSTGRQLNNDQSSLGGIGRHQSNGYSVRLVRD